MFSKQTNLTLALTVKFVSTSFSSGFKPMASGDFQQRLQYKIPLCTNTGVNETETVRGTFADTKRILDLKVASLLFLHISLISINFLGV